jgi:hypothetical protein
MSHRGQGRVGRQDVGELKEQLIPLTINSLLVASHNLKALLQHIQALICSPTHSKYVSEHLHNTSVGAGDGGGTTAAGSVRRSDS